MNIQDKYDASIFIVTDNAEYVYFNEYDFNHPDDCMFIVLTNDMLNSEFGFNNSICIYKDWNKRMKEYQSDMEQNSNIYFSEDDPYVGCPWQQENELIPDNQYRESRYYTSVAFKRTHILIKSLDGYLSCKIIMSHVRPLLKGRPIEEYIPAIMSTFKATIDFDGKTIHGYLPSIGQLIYISYYIKPINFVLKQCNVHLLPTIRFENRLNGLWWSSSEYNKGYSWIYSCGSTDYQHGYKNSPHNIIPLYVLND